MKMNFIIYILAALVPMIMGFIWYNPKVMGTAWMQSSGMTDEKVKGGNMPLIFGLSFLFSIMLGMGLIPAVIHQMSALSALGGDAEVVKSQASVDAWNSFLGAIKGNHRSFGHGALHGTMIGLLIGLPIMGTNAMFERKSLKYVLINVGYWTVTLALMGGILCQTAF